MIQDFKSLFSHICEMKKFVIQLNGRELASFKRVFYRQNYPVWQLDMIWEYFFSDRMYDDIKEIFKNAKLI